MRQFSVFALALVLLAGFHTRGCKVEAQGIHVNAGINIGGNRGVNHNFNAFNAGFNHGYGGFNNNVRVFSPFVQSYNYAVPSAIIVAQPSYVVQQPIVVSQPQVIAQPQVVVQPQAVIQPQAVVAQPQIVQTYAQPLTVVQPLAVIEQPLAIASVVTPYFSAFNSFSPFYGIANHNYAHANFNRNFVGNVRHRR